MIKQYLIHLIFWITFWAVTCFAYGKPFTFHGGIIYMSLATNAIQYIYKRRYKLGLVSGGLSLLVILAFIAIGL